MEQNNLFQFSVDNALEIVLIFNTSGTIVYANNEAKRRLEYDELIGSPIMSVFPGEFQVESGIQGISKRADGAMYDMIAYRQNGTCFPVNVRIVTYKKEQDDELFLCMAQDTTKENYLQKEVNRAGQEAEDALRVKSEFVANVTHELRTPVNGILGNARELMGLETDAEKLKLLQLVERGCRDMNTIINNILDFSKLEAGKFILEPRSFNFRNMVDYVKANHRNRIVEKGLDFSFTVSPEIPDCVIGDELRVVQVLNNLISNAYKFTSVGSIHVEAVKTAQTGNRMELFFMILDTGIGIAKTDQDKLFQSFSQVDASISRKYGGTGLGLNICKQLVELMGGNIHVKSEVGKGSMFSFHIWVEVPECECSGENKEESNSGDNDRLNWLHKLQALTEENVSEKIWEYGEPENLEEIEKKMSKLILSVEMENWEKAEMFADTVKQLVEGAPREVKSASLRLKMAVQKGDYDKTAAAFEVLENAIKLSRA